MEIRISKSKDLACFGVFSAVLWATNDDFCPRTIRMGGEQWVLSVHIALTIIF